MTTRLCRCAHGLDRGATPPRQHLPQQVTASHLPRHRHASQYKNSRTWHFDFNYSNPQVYNTCSFSDSFSVTTISYTLLPQPLPLPHRPVALNPGRRSWWPSSTGCGTTRYGHSKRTEQWARCHAAANCFRGSLSHYAWSRICQHRINSCQQLHAQRGQQFGEDTGRSKTYRKKVVHPLDPLLPEPALLTELARSPLPLRFQHALSLLRFSVWLAPP